MLYFFNLAGAVHDPNDEGVEAASLAEARQMAVRDLADCIRDQPHVIWTGDELRMEVTNADRMILCTVIVFGIDAPGAGGRSPSSKIARAYQPLK